MLHSDAVITRRMEKGCHFSAFHLAKIGKSKHFAVVLCLSGFRRAMCGAGAN